MTVMNSIISLLVRVKVSTKSNAVWIICSWAGEHLLETADIDASTLMGGMVPLLLYADDLNLMSESAAALQQQLHALASFCEQCQPQRDKGGGV